jgi:hypothetical protein
MKARDYTGAFAMAILLCGCVDNHESVTVQTTAGAAAVTGAQCTLSNKKGTWIVTTPGSVSVHLGSEQLAVNCIKDGYMPAAQMENSSVNMGAILINGAIQATVSGAAWTYPQMIFVPMQRMVTPAAPTS